MPNDSFEYRLALVKELLESSKSEHSDTEETFTGLDSKAQNTTAIGGVFLAGALAFFNGDSLQNLVTIGSKPTIILLVVVVFLLTLSTAFCIWAMRIQYTSTTNLAISKEEVEEILNQPQDELSQRYENYLLGQVNLWNQLSTDLHKLNDRKAKVIHWAQMLLGFAVIAVAALLFYTSYVVWKAVPAS